jgi:hypothetical protein
MKIAGALVLALLTVAPAAAQSVTYGRIHTVAIVSLLGDELTMKEPGGAFSSGSTDVMLDTGAHLDDFVTAQIRAATVGRLSVVDGPIDPALFGSLPPAIQARLRPRFAAAGPAPDELIVVAPTQNEVSFDQQYFSVHNYYQGLSLTHARGGLFNPMSGMLSAQYVVSVVDTRTGRVIKAGMARLDPRTLLFGGRPIPLEFCAEGFWPQAPEHPTDAELAQIRIDLTALIAASLPNALFEAGLAAQGTQDTPRSWDGHPLMCK